MSSSEPIDKKHSEKKLQAGYIGATIACALLTIFSFGLILLGVEKRFAILFLFLSALAQVAIQLRYFLHIDSSKQAREDLQLILFSALLLFIMVIGTIWILSDLSERMMPYG